MAGDHEQGDAYRDNSILCVEARDIDAVVVCQEQIRSEDRDTTNAAARPPSEASSGRFSKRRNRPKVDPVALRELAALSRRDGLAVLLVTR
jgi:hypothetical protein